MVFLAVLGAVIAWLGSTLLVVAEGRRGLALGLLLATVGVGVCLAVQGTVEAAAVLLAGGAVAAALGLQGGEPGWRLMPPGSSPRLILCLVLGVLALWLGLSVLAGPGGEARVAVLSALALAGGRLLTGDDRPGALAGAALLAIALGGLGALAAPSLQLATAGTGSLVACLASLLPAAAGESGRPLEV